MDDLGDVGDGVATRLAFDDRLREALDRRERRAQLVRDVGEESLLASAAPLDLARHLVERRAHLGDLTRSRERDPGAIVAASESPNARDKVAERARDRAREERGDENREAERDESAERERWQQCAERVGEDGTWPRDDDEAEPHTARGRLTQLLTNEDPLLAAFGELADVRRRRLGEDRARKSSLAVDHHAPLRRDDEKPHVGGMSLLGEGIDDFARLLSSANAGLDRGEERRGELLEVNARLVVLVLEDEARDRDGGHGEADHHHRKVGEKEPGCDAARHGYVGATSLYPTPQTVSIFASASASLSRSCFTWTSTVRVSPGYANPQTSSSRRSRVSTIPG